MLSLPSHVPRHVLRHVKRANTQTRARSLTARGVGKSNGDRIFFDPFKDLITTRDYI